MECGPEWHLFHDDRAIRVPLLFRYSTLSWILRFFSLFSFVNESCQEFRVIVCFCLRRFFLVFLFFFFLTYPQKPKFCSIYCSRFFFLPLFTHGIPFDMTSDVGDVFSHHYMGEGVCGGSAKLSIFMLFYNIQEQAEGRQKKKKEENKDIVQSSHWGSWRGGKQLASLQCLLSFFFSSAALMQIVCLCLRQNQAGSQLVFEILLECVPVLGMHIRALLYQQSEGEKEHICIYISRCSMRQCGRC